MFEVGGRGFFLLVLIVVVALDARGGERNTRANRIVAGLYLAFWIIVLAFLWIRWFSTAGPPLGQLLLFTLLAGGGLLAAWGRKPLMSWLGLDPKRLLHNFALYSITFYSILNFLLFFVNTTEDGFPTPVTNVMELLTRMLPDVIYILCALFGAGWLFRRDGRAMCARLHLHPLPLNQLLGKILVLYPALFILRHLLLLLVLPLEATPDIETSSELPILALTPLNVAHTLLYMSLLTAFAEELLFRGLLQPRIGILWSSLLFATAHWHYSAAFWIPLFGSSVAYGLVAKRYGLWVAIGLHALHNAFVSIQLYVGAGADAWRENLKLLLLLAGLSVYLWAIFQWRKRRTKESSLFYTKTRYGGYGLGMLLGAGAFGGVLLIIYDVEFALCAGVF